MRDILTFIFDSAARRRQKFREQVEAGSLACAVRPDERVNRAALNFEIHIADGDKAREFFRQIFRFENVFITHTTPTRPCPYLRSVPARLQPNFCASSADIPPQASFVREKCGSSTRAYREPLASLVLIGR